MATMPSGPQGARKKHLRVDTFVAAPEQHISVEAHELKQAIKNRLELEDRVVFDDLCKLMDGVANFDFIDLKERMKENFLPFACGARNSIYLQRSSKNLPTTPMLDHQEDEFIADVYEVLRASHYTLLTKDEWDLATSENFNLNLPMTVNWEHMDDQLLKKFWASSNERKAIRMNLPDCMADRILVFHRGMGIEKLSGLLIDQKLDLLMDYTIFYLLDKVKQPVMDLVKKYVLPYIQKKKKPEEEAAEAAAAAEAEAIHRVLSGVSLDGAAMGQYKFEGNTMIGSKHKFARAVERKTLARQCPTLTTLLKAFPKTMELQEPTFKDIVVVYRRALPPRKPPTAAANAPNKSKDERMKGILQHRNINIKVFGETPMADVEMIFPDKKVGIKPFQLVNLMVTVITALVTGALVLWKAGSDINMNIVWTAASLVLTRCFTVYNTAQMQRTMLQQQMTSTLYDKMQDSQEGVVSVIMEEMADQQLKQMLLAYMLLVIKDRALLQDDLDNACEDFLYKEFDHPIDYDVVAALPRLKRWGLVKTNQQGKLEPLPMPQAIAYLESAWSTAYKVIGSEAASVKTVDMITGDFSVFGAGIDRYVRSQEQAAAAAEAEASKRGFFSSSKAATNISSVGSGITGGVAAGFGKAKAILPFGSGGGKSPVNVTGGVPEAIDGSNSTGTPDGTAMLASPAAAAAAVAADTSRAGTSSKGGASTADLVPQSPVGTAEVLSPESSNGGAHPEKKKSSFKSIFKHKRTTVG